MFCVLCGVARYRRATYQFHDVCVGGKTAKKEYQVRLREPNSGREELRGATCIHHIFGVEMKLYFGDSKIRNVENCDRSDNYTTTQYV